MGFTGKFKVDNFVTVAALAKGHEVPYPVPDIDLGFRQSGVNHAARTHWTDGRIYSFSSPLVLPNNPSVLTVNRSNDWIPQRSLSEAGIDLAPVMRVNIRQRFDSVPCMSEGNG